MAIELDGLLGVSATGNITTDGYFYGNGTHLTGLSVGNADAITSANSSIAFDSNGNAVVNINNANIASFTPTGLDLTGNLNPAANITYDLGNATNQWKDLWLSNATIYMDSIPLNLTQVTLANGAPANTLSVGSNPVVAEYTNANLGNITSSGNISATNSINAPSFNWSNGTPIISNTGNVNIATVSATGNIVTDQYFIGNGAFLTGLPATYANANVVSLLSSGIVTSNVITTGNISGNYFIGNGSQLTGLPTSYSNANAASFMASMGSNSISTTGNIISNNATVNGNLVVTGNATILGNLIYNNTNTITTSNLVLGLGNNQSGSNVNGAGIVVGNTNQAQWLYNFSSQSWVSNISISAVGNVTANYVIGDGSLLTNLPIQAGTYSNANVAAYLPTNSTIALINSNVANTNSNVANLTTASSSTNSNVANTNSNVANLTTSLSSTNSNVANTNSNVANLTTASSSTNSNVANTNSNVANLTTSLANTNSNVANNRSNITTLQGQVYANANVNAYLNSNANVVVRTTGNVTAPYFIGDGSLLTNLPANYTNANVTTLLASGNVTSNIITTGNVTGNFFIGDGSQLTGLPESYGNSNVSTYLASGADTQGFITSGNVNATSFNGDGEGLLNINAITLGNSLPTLSALANTVAVRDGNANINANYFVGEGSALTSINAANISGLYGNIDIASGNYINLAEGATIYSIPTGGLAGTTEVNSADNRGITATAGGNIPGSSYAQIQWVEDITNYDPFGYANAITNWVYVQNDGIYLETIDTFNTPGYYHSMKLDTAGLLTVPTGITGNGNINIGTNHFIGNGSQLTGLPATYSNADVAAYLASGNVTSNIITTGNISATAYTGDGSQLTGIINVIPAVGFTANTTGNNQSFSNVVLSAYANASDITLFYNGALLTSEYYSLAGDVLTINTPIFAGDNINIPQVNVGNVTSIVSSGYGDSNVVALLNSPGVGNITSTGLLVNGNLIVTGNANVQGTLTYNNTTTITTSNLVLGLGNTQTGINVTGGGIVVGNTNEASLLYNFSTQSWVSNINLTTGNANITGNKFTANTIVLNNDNIALGINAGNSSQGANAVAIGINAGQTSQGESSVALGDSAGQANQLPYSVAVGGLAGSNAQSQFNVAVGYQAGEDSQASGAVALGSSAGQNGQGAGAVAVGQYAGQNGQQEDSVAVGYNAGHYGQGQSSVVIGPYAGFYPPGDNAIAIGYYAGGADSGNAQGNNSIILNASGSPLQGPTASALYIKPIRNVANVGNVVTYNSTTSEVNYSNTLSLTGAITAGAITSNGSLVGVNGLTIGSNTSEGGQITLGWANVGVITGQVDRTWNIDVDSGNVLRTFYQNASGSTAEMLRLNPATNTVSMPAGNLSVSGTVTSGNPAFSVWANADQTFPAGQVTLVNMYAKDFDTTNSYNTSTQIYTAPYSGYYQFNGAVRTNNANNNEFSAILYKNNSIFKQGSFTIGGTITATISVVSALVQLNAGETMSLAVYSNQVTIAAYGQPNIYFNGFFVRGL